MLPEKRKETVRVYLEEMLVRGDFGAWEKCFGSSVTFNGRPFSPADFARLRESFLRPFPDLTVTIELQVEEGDTVVTRVTLEGTHRGEFMGVSPSCRRVRFAGIAFDRFERGKIAEMRHFTDDLSIVRQIGAVVKPA